MQIHYSPCKAHHDTIIQVLSEDKLVIDGTEYEFDPDSVIWPDINAQTDGKILEAKRDLVKATGHEYTMENGVTDYVIDSPEHTELYVKVLRMYATSCPWDTGTYQHVEAV